MSLSIAPLIASLNVGPLTVHRPAAPTQNAYGGFDAAADATLEIDPVSVHTLAGRELEQLPEADRNRETIQIYATERLYVADGGKVADRIDYRGRTYRVFRVEDYELQGGVYGALAVLEEKVAP